jgi:F0F1-type ATP synthase delta subunit
MKLKKLLEESDSLSNLIKSPAISKSDKQNSILKILNKAKAQKLTTKFFGTLANNGRLTLSNEVIDNFLSGVSRINGEVKAEVISPFALDRQLNFHQRLLKKLFSLYLLLQKLLLQLFFVDFAQVQMAK